MMKFLNPEAYQPRAHEIFMELKVLLLQILPWAEVEHIGSSAIAGALSKGDLDILVRVMAPEFNTSLAKIQTLGFAIKLGTMRTDSLCMLESSAYDFDTAIQLVEGDSEFDMFTTFRDALRANPQLVQKYNDLKQASTGLSPSEYRARKCVFIESVLARST